MDDILYRKDSKGEVRFWQCVPFTGEGKGNIIIRHGYLGGAISSEVVNTNRAIEAEIASRYKAKRKQGYISLTDVKDNVLLPVKGEPTAEFLRAYLPNDRTTADGSLLPMLAKVYDNTNNKVFKNTAIYLGQWKINGLRCFIRCIETNDLFNNIKFTFQSREGTFWNSLDNLNNYLLNVLPRELIDKMVHEDWILDGELYLPGFSINDINHIVKDPSSPFNALIQFWCYDVYIHDTIQIDRLDKLNSLLYKFNANIFTKDLHLYNTQRLLLLPHFKVDNNDAAIKLRNQFIDIGFEGLIMRDPNLEYETGKRKMIKFKKATDGIFKIIDIIPDGIRRPDVAKLVCRNDINDEQFECHYSGTIDYQKFILRNKDKFIGKTLLIEYGERSGINQLPFHIKNVTWNNPTNND